MREIFADYDPNFLPMSLDEAYLDITEHLEQRRCWPESRRTCYISTDSPSEGAEGGNFAGPELSLYWDITNTHRLKFIVQETVPSILPVMHFHSLLESYRFFFLK